MLILFVYCILCAWLFTYYAYTIQYIGIAINDTYPNLTTMLWYILRKARNSSKIHFIYQCFCNTCLIGQDFLLHALAICQFAILSYKWKLCFSFFCTHTFSLLYSLYHTFRKIYWMNYVSDLHLSFFPLLVSSLFID